MAGVVLALGAGQAAAQELTPSSVTAENQADNYSAKTVQIALPSGEAVWGEVDAVQFTIAGNVARTINGSSSVNIAKDDKTTALKLTFRDDVVVGTSALSYNAPGDAAKGLFTLVSGTDTRVTGLASQPVTVTDADTTPQLPSLAGADKAWAGPFPRNVALGTTAATGLVQMPEVIKGSGNGALVYTMNNLPTGLTFSQNGPDTTPGNTDDRAIVGTPTAADGTYRVLYQVRDENDSGEINVDFFDMTIGPKTPGPPPGSTTLTNATLAINAQNPVEGSMTNVNVVLSAEVPAYTSTRTEVKVTVGAAILTDPTALAALGATSAEDGDFTVSDPSTSNADPTVSTVTFTFPANPSRNSVRRTLTQSFELQARTHDRDAEDEGLTLSQAGIAAVSLVSATDKPAASVHNRSGTTVMADPTNIKIDDDETQNYTLTLKPSTRAVPNPGTEGKTTTLIAKAVPVHVDGSMTMSLHIAADPAHAEYSVTPMVTVGNSGGTLANAVEVTITTPSNDGNRGDDNVTVTMASGSSANPRQWDQWTGAIPDAHALPKIVAVALDANGSESNPQPTTIDEGKSLRFMLRTADKKATVEDIRVALEPGGDADAEDLGDYRLLQSIAIDHGNTQSAPFDLMAATDDDVGAEELILTAVVSGEARLGTDTASNEAATLTIVDNTVKQVEPQAQADRDKAVADAITKAGGDDDGLNPGEMFSVMGTALFKGAATYSATSSNAEVASAATSSDSVIITPKMAGSATITVTAIARPAASSATTSSQSTADRAEVMITVDVKDKTLSVTVTADPMEIVEGGTSTITATANRPVTEDTTINLDVISSDGSDDHTLEIMIANGKESGSTEVGALQDDDYDDMSFTVIATGPGIDGSQNLVIMVMDDDEPPVPQATVRAKDGAAEKIAAAIAKVAGDGGWVAGGMVAEVDMEGLFNVDEGVTAIYEGMSSAPEVVKAMTTGNTLMLTPMGAGTATITVTGADTAGGSEAATVTHDATVVLSNLTVTVSADPTTIEEGGTATITATASRTVAASDGAVTVSLSVVGDATLDSDSITIAAGSDSGSAMLTSTDDANYEPDGETLTVTASGAGIEGNVSVMVGVTDNDMATTYVLSGPADMNIAEGMTAELTVTANQAVAADTEVMIMRDGASTASDADFEVGAVMIMAGETSGSTLLTAVEDNEPDSGSGSPEMLTIYGMAGDEKTNSLTFNIWDAAVPALPLIAQLLLAAFLAVGGYRRYLRR